MKTTVSRRLKKAASALLTALVICSIFSLFVGYYLTLIEQQNLLNNRSQVWNMAISVSEAGIEEGLEHLNDNFPNLSLSPWSSIGGNVYYRSNVLSDGSAYTVYITNSARPSVVARSYIVAGNSLTLSQNLAAGFFAAAGLNPTSPTVVTRAILVTCDKNGLIRAPLVAKKNINLNGNNIATDSFNSCTASNSVNGMYSASVAGDHGDIASNSGVIDSVSGGNANVYGHAHTGANTNGQPTVSIGPNGGVGSHSWQATNKGMQPGWVLQDANFTFPDTTMPDTAGFNTTTGGVLVVSSQVTTTNPVSGASTYPSPVPPDGVTTNLLGTTTSATYPTPAVPGITTNYLTLYVNKSHTYPAPGTYVGNINTSGGGTEFSYYQIVGIASYNVPNYSYSYNTYTTSTVYSTNTYNNIFWGSSSSLNTTNYYLANSLSGNSIVIGDNVTIAAPNGLNMSGNDSFTIVPASSIVGLNSASYPAGATTTIYAGGTSTTISGNAIINQPGYASDFILYCAPSVTSFTLNGNAGFTGVLVAPSVDLTLNGSGTTPIDFVGAAMVNSATLNGHYHFHYDECLANVKKNPRWLILAWNEIP